MSKHELDPRTVVQRRALAKVSKHFLNDKKRRGQINWACGTGKTRLGLSVQQKLARAEKARITVVCCPSLDLVDQIRSEWITNAKQPFVSQSVCSEADDGFINLNRDYAALNATTDPSVIRTTIQECGRQKKPIVLFATYHSLAKIHEALNVARMPKIDLCIFDEAHHCAGTDTIFSQWLSDKDIRIQYRLFLTATPKVVTRVAKEKADEDGLSYTSMDDVAIYGPVLDHISHAEAIERGLIVPYQLNIFTVNDDDLLAKIENPKLTILRRQAAYSGLFRGMKIRGSRKALCYHSGVPEIKELCGLTGNSRHSIAEIWKQCKRRNKIKGKLWAKCIYSDGMSKKHRAEIIREFHEQDSETYAVLLSVRTIREGIDLTGADTVGLMTSMKSTTDIIQASMRGCRRHPGKKRSHIFVPLFTANDSVTKDGEFRGSPIKTDFSNVIDILRSLSIMDPEIVAELKKRYEDDKHGEDFDKLSEQAAKKSDSLKSNQDEDAVHDDEYFKQGRDIDDIDERAAEELGYDTVERYREDVASRIGVSKKRLQTDLIGQILYRVIIPRMLKAYSRTQMQLNSLTVEDIRAAIIEFKKQNRRLPTLKDSICGASVHGVSVSLNRRGLPSVAQIACQLSGLIHKKSIDSFCTKKIDDSIIDFHRNEGRWPTIGDKLCGASITTINQVRKRHGLKTVAQIVAELSCKREKGAIKNVTIQEVADGAAQFFNDNHRWPTSADSILGICIASINQSFKNRGLPSVSKIIAPMSGVTINGSLNKLTVKNVSNLIAKFRKKEGRWPKQKDLISGASVGGINLSLKKRGLTSVAEIIANLSGRVTFASLNNLSSTTIFTAALDFFNDNGRWPNKTDLLFGRTVSGINNVMRHRGRSTVAQIIAEAEAFRANHGRWPGEND